jgi:alkylation response protein AidB-like acyl-CoA dehydrogenase
MHTGGAVQSSKLRSSIYLTTVSTYFTFEDVKVPVENLIGKENEGMKVFMTSASIPNLTNSRLQS